MASKWGTCTKSSRCPFSLAFSMFFPLSMMLRLKQCSPCCVSVGPVELSPKVPSCGMLELTWTSNSLGRGRFILVLLYSFVAAAFILQATAHFTWKLRKQSQAQGPSKKKVLRKSCACWIIRRPRPPTEKRCGRTPCPYWVLGARGPRPS